MNDKKTLKADRMGLVYTDKNENQTTKPSKYRTNKTLLLIFAHAYVTGLGTQRQIY